VTAIPGVGYPDPSSMDSIAPAPRQPPPARTAPRGGRRLVLAAVLAASVGCGPSDGAPAAPPEPPRFPDAHLLLVSIDTLRADRLGCYGYGRETTPHLDALAAESVLFEDMHANSPKTASSHMSLFTSLLPSVHKVRNQSARRGLRSPKLPRNRLTLPQVLARQAYWTACVASGANVQERMGFGRGFGDRFESRLVDVRAVLRKTLTRLDQLARSGRSGFVFAHTYQVHSPYLPPDPWRERFAPRLRSHLAPRVRAYAALPFDSQWKAAGRATGSLPAYWDGLEDFGEAEARDLSDLYDGEIAYTDGQVGRLIDEVRARGLLEETILVVLSDHGEEFGEHDEFQHDQLFAEHLTAEYRVQTEARGRVVDEWKLRAGGPDNHWFDCLVGCGVAASIQGAVLPGTEAKAATARQRLRLSEIQRSRR